MIDHTITFTDSAMAEFMALPQHLLHQLSERLIVTAGRWRGHTIKVELFPEGLQDHHDFSFIVMDGERQIFYICAHYSDTSEAYSLHS